MALLTDEHRAWVGRAEAPVEVEVCRREIVKYAVATEQVQEKYLNGDEAPPMFIFNLFGMLRPPSEIRPDGLDMLNQGPTLPLKRIMAGGTEIHVHRPIVPGDRLVGIHHITDMFEKEGSTGALIFMIRKLEVRTVEGEPVMDEIQTLIAR